MISDIIQIFGLLGCIIIMWFQRKTIFELENHIWEIERSYRKETGKFYQYKFNYKKLWGEDGGTKEKEQI